MEVRCVAQGIWPQGKVHCLRPAGASVEQLLAHALREVANVSLSNAILKMGMYPAKGELLSCVMACSAEGVVMETPIVTVVIASVQ